jgi:hypothetical protein
MAYGGPYTPKNPASTSSEPPTALDGEVAAAVAAALAEGSTEPVGGTIDENDQALLETSPSSPIFNSLNEQTTVIATTDGELTRLSMIVRKPDGSSSTSSGDTGFNKGRQVRQSVNNRYGRHIKGGKMVMGDGGVVKVSLKAPNIGT